ncbi:MAG TPA: insulinase family protein [Burkholderiaceae bacterium]
MTTFRLCKTLATASFLLLSWCAQGASNLSAPIPLDPALKEGVLPNGLHYYILKNGKPEKRVELRLVVKAGSILEDDDQQGLAHFTEHMEFDGSRHFQKHELISYLQSIGVKFGADLNAYTSFDETVYILPIPTGKKENLETGFRVLEDWAQGASLKDDAIDAEAPVVLEELRLGRGADERMGRKLLPEVYEGSRYASRLPIGKEEILKTFKHDALRRFYRDWYRPDLEAVVVVGDVEPAQAEKMIREHFSRLKNPAHERARTYAQIAPRTESRALVVTDPEATNNGVTIRYPSRQVPPDTTIGDYRRSLVRTLYTTILNEHLHDLTEQADAPYLAAFSGIGSVAPGYEAFSTTVIVGRAGVEPAIKAAVEENERVRQFGFGADELDRAKRSLLRNYEEAFKEGDKSDSGTHAAELIRHFLVQEAVPGIAGEYAYVSEFLPSITLEEVNAYAKTMTPSATVPKLVAYMGSSKDGETVPSEAGLLQWVANAEQSAVAAKEEKKLAAKLMIELPKPGKIVSEQENKALGLHELTLSNGIKVILKPTDFQNDQVLMSAARFGGQSLYDDKDKYNAQYASSVAGAMGVADFTPTEVGKILSGRTAQVNANISGFSDQLSGASGRDDIETMLQLLYLRMTSPRQDPTLFSAYIAAHEDSARNSMSRPEAVFTDSLQATLYDNNPRASHIPKPEDFAKIDLGRASAIFQERFGSAYGLTFIFVGSFDVDKIKPLLETYLASLPAAPIPVKYRDLGVRPVAGVVKKDVRVGSEPKSSVSLTFTGPAKYSLAENTHFYMMIEAINIKIIDDIREKMSLIYGGGMSGALERAPYEHYQIGASLPCGPENVDKVIAAVFAEIDQMKQNGPPQADLDKVKRALLEQHNIDLHTNSYWENYLQDTTLYGTDPSNVLTFEKRVNDVTVDDLKEAARRYFNTANYVQAVQYPAAH